MNRNRGIQFRSCRLALLAVFGAWLVTGCVSNLPINEWALARASYEAARDNDAPRYVPALWFKTEQTYREAQRAYKERDYPEAKKLFALAKTFGEQAENAARLARFQSGEVVP